MKKTHKQITLHRFLVLNKYSTMQNIDLIFTSVFEVKMKEHSFHFYVIVQLQFF